MVNENSGAKKINSSFELQYGYNIVTVTKQQSSFGCLDIKASFYVAPIKKCLKIHEISLKKILLLLIQCNFLQYHNLFLSYHKMSVTLLFSKYATKFVRTPANTSNNNNNSNNNDGLLATSTLHGSSCSK